MTRKRILADNYDFSVNSTNNFDAIKLYVKDEVDSANNLEVKCDNFTINDTSTILEDYDAYIEEKEQERRQKRKNLLVKLIDYLRMR